MSQLRKSEENFPPSIIRWGLSVGWMVPPTLRRVGILTLSTDEDASGSQTPRSHGASASWASLHSAELIH